MSASSAAAVGVGAGGVASATAASSTVAVGVGGETLSLSIAAPTTAAEGEGDGRVAPASTPSTAAAVGVGGGAPSPTVSPTATTVGVGGGGERPPTATATPTAATATAAATITERGMVARQRDGERWPMVAAWVPGGVRQQTGDGGGGARQYLVSKGKGQGGEAGLPSFGRDAGGCVDGDGSWGLGATRRVVRRRSLGRMAERHSGWWGKDVCEAPPWTRAWRPPPRPPAVLPATLSGKAAAAAAGRPTALAGGGHARCRAAAPGQLGGRLPGGEALAGGCIQWRRGGGEHA